MGVSLRPSDAVKGGSVIDDCDIEVVGAKVGDEAGTSLPSAVYVILDLQTADGEVHAEYLKAADSKFFAPSRDGKTIEPISDKGSLIDSSKFILFANSAVGLGFPEDKISDDPTAFVGLKAHVKRSIPDVWKNLPKQEGKRDAMALLVTAIHALPGAKAAGKGAAKPAAKAAAPAAKSAAKPAAAAASAGGDVDEEATALVVAAIDAAGGSITVKDLVPAVFRSASGANKRAIVKRVAEEDFLIGGMATGAWGFEDDTLTAAA